MNGWCGIILAGGRATRLFPMTKVVSKQLVAVYDKPMIYYPLSTLMLAGIRDILVITTPEANGQFQQLLGTGDHLGIHIEYATQLAPRGLADAFIVGEKFIGQRKVALILGDNIFYGNDLIKNLNYAMDLREGARIFGHEVKDPCRYGVVEVKRGLAVSIEEKPIEPRSNLAVPGLYFFDNRVISFAKKVESSARGEIEIVDIIREYMNLGRLGVTEFGRGFIWFDAGTDRSLLQAANFICAAQDANDLLIGGLEEIACCKGWISPEQLLCLADQYNNEYGDRLKKAAREQSKK